jgi:type IV pilus biogenesis protein CpaD/CtpE
MTNSFRLAAATCIALLVSGCDALEPYQRAYTWHPTGATEANLAAMVENPADLVHGRGLGQTDGVVAAMAVDRLWHDRVKPLADSSSTSNSTPSAAAGLTGN